MSSLIFAVGADRAPQYFTTAKEISLSKGLILALGICLCGSAVTAVASLPPIHSDLPFFRKADTGLFHLAPVLISFISSSLAVQYQLSGLRRFRPLAVLLTVQPVAAMLGIIMLVWKLGMGWTAHTSMEISRRKREIGNLGPHVRCAPSQTFRLVA